MGPLASLWGFLPFFVPGGVKRRRLSEFRGVTSRILRLPHGPKSRRQAPGMVFLLSDTGDRSSILVRQ